MRVATACSTSARISKRGPGWATDGRNLLEAADLEALRARESVRERPSMRLYT
ncbi:hypothetical protein [Streptomyces sp. HUAS ZL42]|uniref:hypothetical protein n=1 Tax=Streptomyces sp. HUAS ZL42 TaxID=3231715 RepID=UPI00345E583D